MHPLCVPSFASMRMLRGRWAVTASPPPPVLRDHSQVVTLPVVVDGVETTASMRRDGDPRAAAELFCRAHRIIGASSVELLAEALRGLVASSPPSPPQRSSIASPTGMNIPPVGVSNPGGMTSEMPGAVPGTQQGPPGKPEDAILETKLNTERLLLSGAFGEMIEGRTDG